MNWMRRPFCALLLAATALSGLGCVQTDPPMFAEAPRPEGWPQLTPLDEIHVKRYPAYRAAVISSDEVQGERQRSNGMFRPLFNHIKRSDIAMTAPVEMTYQAGQPTSMAFLYRTTQQGQSGADENDPRIAVRDIPAQYAASMGVRGGYNAERFDKAVQTLRAWLATREHLWEVAGEPRYMGYNSPFVPAMLRYGEVQIPLKRAR